ncbi:MAG TPA: hypothetical protein VL426_07555 [Candidatus Binatia bacterium]|jgi:hypothetical protein|nr:hypothetical protein [Candidatus Binatia bacterium]
MPVQYGPRRSDVIFTLILVAACMFTLGGAFVYGAKKAASSKAAADQDGRSNREIVMSCTTDMATQFHIHPELTIMIDGEKRTIPANIGIDDGCMHPLHTHDDTGVIHVEAPVKRDFTLGDFFAVWHMPFDKDHVLDKTADAGHEVRLLVNGELSQDYGNLLLKDKDKIMIAYQKKAQ